MEIQVLVENTSGNKNIKGKHGLSLLIQFNGKSILYDFGPKNSLLKNAEKLTVQLEKIDLAVLSHNHLDHGGDLNDYCKINTKSSIHVVTDLKDKLYAKVLGFLKFPVGVTLNPAFASRLIIHRKSEEIAEKVYVVKLSEYANDSVLNKDLLVKIDNKYKQDNFYHESALVINENNELVVFCSCSHHGVSYIVNDVENYFPGKRIKAFIGGFHMCNPVSQKNESLIHINDEINKLKMKNIRYYTGHCTGDFAFSIFKEAFKDNVKKLSTGMRIEV